MISVMIAQFAYLLTSLNNDLLSTYYIPDSLIGPWSTKINKKQDLSLRDTIQWK